ncbi:HD domain-containing protein [Actinomadura sp. KC216]|uniref:HD domain-containing protein n=1 Tax=Actinomadura sp. KC216 TaxID=2530370 RepID=UPI001051A814|nr:HD domain-containing protein [Actinomadura sp. KC216]TDB91668.1 HD domain-containing protein [Actinomadura sp. KC216]
MRIPTDDEIRALHERYAPTAEALELVWTHCAIVCEIAEQVMDGGGFDVDKDLVRAGCLLHDIGVYRLYDAAGTLDHKNYVKHGLLGHELLHAEGFPEPICRFCSRHTGLARDDIERQQLPIPAGDYLAESAEERLVAYADRFHSKTDPPTFVTADSYIVRARRFGERKIADFQAMREHYGEPDLTSLAADHGHAIV